MVATTQCSDAQPPLVQKTKQLLETTVTARHPNNDDQKTSLELLDAPEQPATDEQQYRALKLGNGMRVLLVHDPRADKAAAAVDVSFSPFKSILENVHPQKNQCPKNALMHRLGSVRCCLLVPGDSCACRAQLAVCRHGAIAPVVAMARESS